MIGTLVKYVSARPCSRAGQLGIVLGWGGIPAVVGTGCDWARVKWLEDGQVRRHRHAELEVVQTA